MTAKIYPFKVARPATVRIYNGAGCFLDVPVATEWDEGVVTARMVEAMATLIADHALIGPKGFGSSMPDFVYTADEVDAPTPGLKYLAETQAAERALREIADRPAKPPAPTGRDLRRMGEALRWPAVYLGDRPALAGTVNAWAWHTAADRDFDGWVASHGWRPSLARRCARAGVKIIAAGLNRDGVPL